MDAAVSSSMGAMGPLLRKLDLLLAPEYRLQKQLKDGISLLKADLEELLSTLEEPSWFLETTGTAECWIMEARELSYYLDDGIDGMMSTRTGIHFQRRSTRSHRVGRVKIRGLPEMPKRSTRIARIAEFRSRLQGAIERHQKYHPDAARGSSSHVMAGPGPVPALYGDPSNLVGIDGPKFQLIEMLDTEAEQQLKVVTIVGPAGVGKTTLANEIYRELGRQFECQAFVRVSRKPNMRRLLGGILSQIWRHQQPRSGAGSVQSLIDDIQDHLRDKRYLIVIDDLWERAAWDIVSRAFPDGKKCSRIIATTENMTVARECCGYLANNVLKMKPLGIQDSRKIFFSQVYGSEHQCRDEMKEVSYGIVRICGGLPLGIISIAGLLASQSNCFKLWHHVQECLCIILNRCYTVEAIQKEILNLSYNSLPSYLKTCLLYFSMYPEGFIIWKVHLVKQWVAEGFINAVEGNDIDEIAEGYFDELVNRGMIQPLQIEYNDEVLSCTMHHIVHDLITEWSKKENFIDTVDYSQNVTELSTKARRLSLHFSSSRYAQQPAGTTVPQLRSLAFFGLPMCVPLIERFKLLRVLMLELYGDHGGCTNLNLSRICRLFLLRYLKISSDIMVELPVQMKGLQNLETLEIDARILDVPGDIVHLPSLLHLSLREATALPDGIGLITSLTTLLYFDLSHNSEANVWSLSRLTNLRHLHLTCSTLLSNEHLKRMLIPLVSCLGRFGNLKSLTISPVAFRTANFLDISAKISSPSIILQRLELLPPICLFSILPNRIGQFDKLQILKITIRELPGNNINNLTGLPSLAVLLLYVRTALEGTIVFTNMAFPALKYFKFRCSVMYLAFKAGAMPNLRRLKLCFNTLRGENYVQVLSGVENLLNLQEIVGRIGEIHGADESNRSVVKSLLEDAIRKHPRCPRFSIKWVDLVEEECSYSGKQDQSHKECLSGEHEILEKDSTENMCRSSDSRLVGYFDLLSASSSGHLKSDKASNYHTLASIESAVLPGLDLSLLKDITNNFSSEQEIGRSAFGVVYKGMLRDGIVAVKRQYGRFATLVAQLGHVNLLREVKHSNIARFLGSCWDSQDTLLCFEYVHNGNLRRHITDESCGLEWRIRYQIINGICNGLHYLHERSIIHSDLKPENILLDSNMVPKIADYGYTTLFSEDGHNVAQRMFTSLEYMPPEYISDEASITTKSDIFSLGVLIMQIVTGYEVHPNIETVFRGWKNRLQLDTSQKHMAFEEAYHQVKLCIEIGMNCMDHSAQSRPDTRDIIHSLGEAGNRLITHQPNEDSVVSLASPSAKGKDNLNCLGQKVASVEAVQRIRELFAHTEGTVRIMDDVYKELKVLESIADGREKPIDITLPLLQLITEKFSEQLKIAHGGCGLVYKGILPNRIIAVKKFFSHHTIDDKMFHGEVKSLMKVAHKNTVRFLGYCSHTEEKVIDIEEKFVLVEVRERLVCLEYISNGSLENHLTDELRGLDWHIRYQIIKGICEGLDHLHRENHIIHMDLKPANILLDDEMVPKITDFGLSRFDDASQTMSEKRLLSLGYCAPEYQHDGRMSLKSDIYSLGVIILELVTGSKEKPSINKVLRRWKHRWNKSAKDITLGCKQVTECLDLVQRCTHADPTDRPNIWDIISDFIKMDSTDVHSHATECLELSGMLGIEPLEVHLPIELNKLISCSIELTNNTDDCFAFRIMTGTTSHRHYDTHPNNGIVPPRSKFSITITLQGLEKAPRPDHLMDEFSVQSTIVDKSITALDITREMFNEKQSKVVDKVNLLVVLDVPGQPNNH